MTPVTITHPTAGTPGEPLAAVATMLDPHERPRVDAAGIGVYRALHRDSLDDVFRDLRERPIGAVLVSVCRCADRDAAKLARLVREFPRVPAVALLTQLEQQTPRAVLAEGRSDDIQRLALARIAEDLPNARADCQQFFELVFRPRAIKTVRDLARALGVLPSTLMSRFFRTRLPAPKRYLATARLVRDRRSGENGDGHSEARSVRAYARRTSSRSDSQICRCSSRKRGSKRISCTSPRGRGRSIS